MTGQKKELSLIIDERVVKDVFSNCNFSNNEKKIESPGKNGYQTRDRIHKTIWRGDWLQTTYESQLKKSLLAINSCYCVTVVAENMQNVFKSCIFEVGWLITQKHLFNL